MSDMGTSGVETISDLTLAQLERYLASKGWSKTEKGPLLVFSSPSDAEQNTLKYILPADENVSDFRHRAFDVIKGVAHFQGSLPSNVIEEIFDAEKDPAILAQTSMRVKISDDIHPESYSINLGAIETVLAHTKQLLAHSVTMETSPPKPWRRNPAKTAVELAQQFEFCQTERGSFIVNIRTPKEVTRQVSFVPEPSPPEVRSLLRIARGLSWLVSQSTDLSTEESRNSYKTGLNANIADHIIEMKEAIGARNIQLVFSINEETKRQAGITSQVFQIDGALSGKLRNISNVFKTKTETTIEVLGKIIRMDSKDPSQDQISHKVLVETLPTQKAGSVFASRKFHLELSKDEYQNALDAHGNSKSIQVKGIFVDGPDGLQIKSVVKISM